MQRALRLFEWRFPMVIADLLAMPADRPIIAEGFGLTPVLVQPHLPAKHHAIWFVPTEKFKRDSMERRGKPSWSNAVRDPAKGKYNLFTRDMLLADHIAAEVQAHGGRLVEIDGSQSRAALVDLVAGHFQF